MTNITTTRIINRFSSRVRAYARSGISWGTDNIPPDADANWFGGSISGPTALPTDAGLGNEPLDSKYGTANTDADAVSVRTELERVTQLYSYVQRVRILIYRTKSGYSNNTKALIYDETAVAYLTSIYAETAAIADGTLVAGNGLTWNSVYQFIERCYNRMVHQKGTTQRTFSRDVCHTSCHSNCHSNRGRR